MVPFPRTPKAQWTFQRRPDWGDVYWFDFGYPTSGQRAFAGYHPALIIAVAGLILPGTTQIVPLSGAENKRQGYQFHVLVAQNECLFLEKDSIVKVDQIYCVHTNELPDQYYIGTMRHPLMRRIYSQLLGVIGADRLTAA